MRLSIEISGSKMASCGHVGTGLRAFLPHFHPVTIMKVVIFVFTLVELCSSVADDVSDDTVYFDELYAEGVKAYNDQLWYKCAYNLEKAMKDYNKFKKSLTECRMMCKKDQHEYLDKMPYDVAEFSVFATFFKHAECFRSCKSDIYKHRPGFRLNENLQMTFETRRPYQFLQFCWYKLDRVEKAASASYTYYLSNPEDEDVRVNIAFYRDKAKVPESQFVDLELKPYKEHFIRARLAYADEDWLAVVDQMEKATDDFFVEEERCRVDCEDQIEFDSESENRPSHFSGLIADHIVRVLDCQLGCEGNLSVVYSEPMANFVADHFHYLQFAYYKLEKIQEAVEATASYLLFEPEDEIVKENKHIFMKKYQYSEDQFIPRKEAQEYMERRHRLRHLLDFLNENLMPEVPDTKVITHEDTIPEVRKNKPAKEYNLWMERYERLGLHIIAKEKELKRPYRFAADGLLKPELCEDILPLMDEVKVDGKGVQTFTMEQGRKKLITSDEDYEASMRLFMRATEVMRHYTLRYYNLSESLYFKNATIVCWRHVIDPDVESDCIPQEFGTCEPESSVKDSKLVEDQFVTATYLNSLDDGDVYFLGENVSVDTSLGVKMGRMIGFQSGDRHGLHIPTSGSRCAIVIAYTTYRSEDEMDYIAMIEMLQRLEELRMKEGFRNKKDVMEKFDKMGVHVVKNGSALQGKERVVADGMATDAECVSLKNMVMEVGNVGDGYGGHESPHTENELFLGVGLDQLSQSGALVGDGYEHLEEKPSLVSPHTEHELFLGLSVYRAAKLMYMGLVNTLSMKSFLDISENSRLFVEKYFNLTRPLYFDFTHLVCRRAVEDNKERDDLSHPVHADNCALQPDGSCIKQYPSYAQRDYSAILYLNDDFQGGEFFFAYPNRSEQVSVRPKCGRLVAFNAAELHGVKAVRSGVRCALALWFTLNPSFKEVAQVHAKKVLRTIQRERDFQDSERRGSALESEVENDQNVDTQEQSEGEAVDDQTSDTQEQSEGEAVDDQTSDTQEQSEGEAVDDQTSDTQEQSEGEVVNDQTSNTQEQSETETDQTSDTRQQPESETVNPGNSFDEPGLEDNDGANTEVRNNGETADRNIKVNDDKLVVDVSINADGTVRLDPDDDIYDDEDDDDDDNFNDDDDDDSDSEDGTVKFESEKDGGGNNEELTAEDDSDDDGNNNNEDDDSDGESDDDKDEL